MTNNNIRLLTLDDLAIFHSIRLRACREEPTAFMEDYEELAPKPLRDFHHYFENGWIAGAFLDEQLVGTAGLFRHKGLKVAHKGTVWGVYVTPEARGHGFSKRCIEMVLSQAEQAGIELVQLTTDVNNKQTIALYKIFGFEPWGVEEHCIKLADGRYVNEIVMTKFFVKY